ncbi:MAG: alpha/beta hydrolase [Methanomicrobia archaeon]|nr:alpha/beta hydrolase [Methanomicrobia archaeon]
MTKQRFMRKCSIFFRTRLKIPFRLHIRNKRIVSPTAPTYVFIHGLADNGSIWKKIVDRLPSSVNYIVVDLLGHGESLAYAGKVYDANYQARNVIRTCLGLGCVGKYIFVGHSFGSIVSVECAHRYIATKRLVLCSLPLYNGSENKAEKRLFDAYNKALKHPEIITLAYRLANKSHIIGGESQTTLNKESLPIFQETLHSGIMNQKTQSRMLSLKMPIDIIYGRFDPLLVAKNIKSLPKRSNINITAINSDHSPRSIMFKAALTCLSKDW